MLILSLFDKRAVPQCPHDKDFHASNSTQITDDDVTIFPAPADPRITNVNIAPIDS